MGTTLLIHIAAGGLGLLSGYAVLFAAKGVGLTSLAFGFEALAAGGTRKGMPAFPFFLVGVVGVVAGAGDLRVLRSGALRGHRS